MASNIKEDFRSRLLRELNDVHFDNSGETLSDLSDDHDSSVVGSDLESLLEGVESNEVASKPTQGLKKHPIQKDFYQLYEEKSGTLAFHNSEIFHTWHPTATDYEVLRRDVTNLILRFCDGETTFDHFCRCWQDKKFSLIFCTKNTFPDVRLPIHYLFYHAKKYLVSRYPRQMRIGGIFLLYGIFTQQPACAFPKQVERIQLTLEEYREVFKPLYLDLKHGDQSHEGLYVFCHLFGLNAFEFSRTPQKIIGPFLTLREAPTPRLKPFEKQLAPYFEDLVKELAEQEKQCELLKEEIAARSPGEQKLLQGPLEGLERRRDQLAEYVERQVAPLLASSAKEQDSAQKQKEDALDIGERRRLLKGGGSLSKSPDRVPRFLRSSAHSFSPPASGSQTKPCKQPSHGMTAPDSIQAIDNSLLDSATPVAKKMKMARQIPADKSVVASSASSSTSAVPLRTSCCPQKPPTSSKVRRKAGAKVVPSAVSDEQAIAEENLPIKRMTESSILAALEMQAVTEATELLKVSKKKGNAKPLNSPDTSIAAQLLQDVLPSQKSGEGETATSSTDPSNSKATGHRIDESDQRRSAKREKFFEFLKDFTSLSPVKSLADCEQRENELLLEDGSLSEDEWEELSEDEEGDDVEMTEEQFEFEKNRVRAIIDKSKTETCARSTNPFTDVESLTSDEMSDTEGDEELLLSVLAGNEDGDEEDEHENEDVAEP